MLTAGQIAKKMNVSVHAVRHYVKLGLLHPIQDPVNQYHFYSDNDMHRLRFILNAKYLGFTLKEIAVIIEESQSGRSVCPMVRGLLKKRIAKNQAHIKQLVALQKKMERLYKAWSDLPNAKPTPQQTCHLIDKLGDIDI